MTTTKQPKKGITVLGLFLEKKFWYVLALNFWNILFLTPIYCQKVSTLNSSTKKNFIYLFTYLFSSEPSSSKYNIFEKKLSFFFYYWKQLFNDSTLMVLKILILKTNALTTLVLRLRLLRLLRFYYYTL